MRPKVRGARRPRLLPPFARRADRWSLSWRCVPASSTSHGLGPAPAAEQALRSGETTPALASWVTPHTGRFSDSAPVLGWGRYVSRALTPRPCTRASRTRPSGLSPWLIRPSSRSDSSAARSLVNGAGFHLTGPASRGSLGTGAGTGTGAADTARSPPANSFSWRQFTVQVQDSVPFSTTTLIAWLVLCV